MTFATAVCTALYLWWLLAFRFVLSNDEGIYLDGAVRILKGQVPYRDFFILMGPGTFWIQGLSLRIFGVSLAASRVVTIGDIAVLTGCVFWIVARRFRAVYAAWIAGLFLILETAYPGIALPNHRWDSAAFAIIAATILTERPRAVLVFLAGACAAFAAWITPTLALVGLSLIILLVVEARSLVRPFVAGCSLVSFGCAVVLAAQHALLPMMEHMLWSGRNYGGANFMPYGSCIGGYAQLFQNASGAEFVTAALVVIALSIPALLPPMVLSAAWAQREDWTVRVLSITGLAMLAATYPRMDVAHLVYAAPAFYALAALLAGAIARPWIRITGFAAPALLAAIFVWYSAAQRASETVLLTRAGVVRASARDTALIAALNREIPPGSDFFAFPYLPVAYFITLGNNPTRYSYLQPGMMADADESAALNELQARPPAKVLYQDVRASFILKIWPSSDPARLRLRRIESYLAARYHVSTTIPYAGGAFQILERNGADP